MGETTEIGARIESANRLGGRRRRRPLLVAAATVTALAAVFAVAWVAAAPPAGHDEAVDSRPRPTSPADTSVVTTPTPGSGTPRRADDGSGRDLSADGGPLRLVYEVERNDGTRTDRVFSRDDRRWSVRDDENWSVHDGERTVRCAIDVSCQTAVGPEAPAFQLTLWTTSSLDGLPHHERRIAGIEARCVTFPDSGATTCASVADGLILLTDPGDAAMRPSPFRSERVELVSVGEPRDADFEPPSA